MSNWQPIETAPKDGASILAYCRSFDIGAQNFYAVVSCRSDGQWTDGWQYLGPTHWKPLDAPPAS